MSSADGPGADSRHTNQPGDRSADVLSQLVEALILALIEKGVLTRNDALSVIQTVAQVQRGSAPDGDKPPAALPMLERLYSSFEALAERRGAGTADWKNVRALRPPIHDDRPEFPRED